ncbi:MAG: GntR family transcriptional regulator, partial [SAR324 cluster bacterium]|nr:GntR family transcriptional regulator [SAR324 cluster bacterium]
MITWQESNIERPKSLVQIAADAIRRGIILRELVLGQPLTEAGLAKTLGISKTPVREGLSLLRSEGLVVAEPHRGYRVFNMTQEELVDFCELRFALESQALRYAVQRRPLKLAKKLQQILTEMEANFSPKNREKYFELDTNFHKSFFRFAESRFLLQHY